MNVEDWTARLAESTALVALKALEFLPQILGSLALLLIGWLAARILRGAVQTLMEGILGRLVRQRLARTKAVDSRTAQSRTWQSIPSVVAGVVYWGVMLFFIAAAIEALGLRAVSNVVGLVIAFLPRVLAGVAIVLVGLWAGEFLRTLIARAAARSQVAYGELVGRFVQVIVTFEMVIIAVEQLGVDSTILITTLVTILAAALGAAALAFGFGARDAVSNIIAARYVRRTYQPGDEIRLGEVEGRVSEITETAVMVEADSGRTSIPARRFLAEASVLVRARK